MKWRGLSNDPILGIIWNSRLVNLFSAPPKDNIMNDLPCPLCGCQMTVIPDDTGIMVKCFNIPCDPRCKENVEGHGRTEKEALVVAGQKYRKS